ncbi:unnamed protein product [Cuscuta campestris]|uniref:Uncharacterized protein n=1 Tax=Cuscuta campestris TaxID=132261 RepID=A0A484L6H3_9ASTE|nr:unnamed protein product [Cuscuta campestris]
MNKFFFFLLIIFPVLGVSAGDDCGYVSGGSEGQDRSEALRYKVIAVASILSSGAAGVTLPLVGRRFPAFSPESKLFVLVKAFAAGVILATGFVHVLPDAFESLGSPCLPDKPWGGFPFPGLVAMLAAIATMMVDLAATSYYKRAQSDRNKPKPVNDEEMLGQHPVPVHTHATHGHAHGSLPSPSGEPDITRGRVISQVLELGIVVHSVIIGISLGASVSANTIKPLVVALTFHQLFEGMGLGGCIVEARFDARATKYIMATFFSLTTPIGIAIGFGISNIYHESSPTALIVEGILNSASAGILIYMALVDLIAADFMSARMQHNLRLQMGANVSLLLGAALMSLLAIWA